MAVHVASILELLNAPPASTRPAAKSQSSDASPQTFLESLLATSKASSDIVSARDSSDNTGQNEVSSPGELKTPATESPVSTISPLVLNLQPASQPVLAAQQKLSTSSASIQVRLPPSKAAAVQPKRDPATTKVSGTESNITQPAVAKSDNIQSSQPPSASQAASILPSPVIPTATIPPVVASQTADNSSPAVVSMIPDPLSNTMPSQTPVRNVPATPVSSGIPTVKPVDVQKAVKGPIQNFEPSTSASEVPSTLPTAAQAGPQTSLPSTGHSEVPVSLPSVAQSSAPSHLPSTTTVTMPSATPVTVQNLTPGLPQLALGAGAARGRERPTAPGASPCSTSR
jgi:hypothetical protein